MKVNNALEINTKEVLKEAWYFKSHLKIVVDRAEKNITDPEFWQTIDPSLRERIVEAIEDSKGQDLADQEKELISLGYNVTPPPDKKSSGPSHVKEEDLKDGQRVRIRTWSDMAEEYGTISEGNVVRVPQHFTEDMEDGIPDDRIITIKKTSTGFGCNNWAISPEMIEEIVEDPSESDISWDGKEDRSESEMISGIISGSSYLGSYDHDMEYPVDYPDPKHSQESEDNNNPDDDVDEDGIWCEYFQKERGICKQKEVDGETVISDKKPFYSKLKVNSVDPGDLFDL